MRSLGIIPEASASGAERWRLFTRGGRVLMVLSTERKDFCVGLSLYVPLRRLARLAVKGLLSIPLAAWFLRARSFSLQEDGVCGRILAEMSVSPVAFLFGNPSQKERRAIMLCRDAEGALQVAKIGVSPQARVKISEEVGILSKLKEAVPNAKAVPLVLWSMKSEDWAAFQLPFFRAGVRKEWAMPELIVVLTSWMSGEPAKVFLETASWQRIKNGLSATDQAEASELLLTPTLRHGDFAPWNILETQNLKPMVIDWEFAQINDVPGWDLVHYVLMQAHLVSQNSKEETIRQVKSVLTGDQAVRGYLAGNGWCGHEDLLLKSYLLSMGNQLDGFLEVLGSENLPTIKSGDK